MILIWETLKIINDNLKLVRTFHLTSYYLSMIVIIFNNIEITNIYKILILKPHIELNYAKYFVAERMCANLIIIIINIVSFINYRYYYILILL